MSEEAWRPVLEVRSAVPERPWDFDRIEIWREGWPAPIPTEWEKIDPLLNANGLMWRPVSERRKPGPYQLPHSSARFSSLPLSLGRVFGLE